MSELEKIEDLVDYYKNLPENIIICVGKKCYIGKEIAEEIKKGTKIGKLVLEVEKIARERGL